VLIRRLSEKKELKLVLKNGDVVKMKTRWIPQLIDYGMSSMMIDGKFVTNRFNEHKEETKNVLDLQDEPLKYFLSMYDIWRYVTFFVGSLWDAQYEGFEEVWKRLIIPFYKLSKGVVWSKPTKVSEMFSKMGKSVAGGGALGKKLGELLLDNRLSRDLELSDVGWLKVDVEEYLREVLRG
jgi:hypothetical protein